MGEIIRVEKEFELGVSAGLSLPSFETRQPPIRSTPLATLDECPRKFLYVNRWGISPKTLDKALSLGSFLHLTLSSLFQGQSEEEALSVTETSMKEYQNLLLSWADPAGFLPNGQDVKKALEDLDEQYHKARAMAIVFWRFNAFDSSRWSVLNDPEGRPMVERIIEVKVKGLTQPIRATCDLALVDKKTGEVWIVDFKTTKFDARKRSMPTRFSPQVALYRIALQLLLDHWNEEETKRPNFKGSNRQFVAGSFHAIIQTAGIKYCPRTKDKEEGFPGYIKRLVKWYQDKRAEDPDNPPMLLDPNRFGGPLLTREFWRRLVNYCAAATHSPDPAVFHRAGEGACFKYNRVCPFMTLCVSDQPMWPGLIEQYYTIRFREDEEEPHDGE